MQLYLARGPRRSGYEPALRADTTVVFAGGNASATVLYDRASNILSGLSVVISNSTIETFTGTLASQPGLGNVTIGSSC